MVLVFRVVSAVLVRVPLRFSEPLARVGFTAGYYLWPSKRHIIHANAAHVLGLPSTHPDVARMARAIYGTYARFVIELMRLPNLPADEPVRLVHLEGEQHERFMALWHQCQREGRGIIAVSGHIGSIEVFAGAYAQQGIPTYGLADDSAFRELFELLNTSRARWGVTIIPWRRLRDIFKVMRHPAILGMVVDWGYRADDLPVRLFGSWTTLPAGPATLAARTGAVIVPVLARRRSDGRYDPIMYGPIEVADATAIGIGACHTGDRGCPGGDDLGGSGPVVHLQADVARHHGRERGPGPARGGEGGLTVSGRMSSDHAARTASATPPPAPPLSAGQRILFKLLIAGLWVARKLPDKPLYRVAYAIGAGLYLLLPDRRDLVRRNLQRVCEWLVTNEMASPRVAMAARDREALDRMVRAAFGHWVVTYAEAALAPSYSAEELRRRLRPVYPATSAETVAPRAPGEVGLIHLAMHFGSVDLSAMYGARVGSLPLTGPMEFVGAPFARAYFERVRNELDVTIVPLENAAQALVAALERGEAVGIVADRNIVGRGSAVELFGATTRLPIGPAMLAVQTGAPLYLQAIERIGPGDWIGHTVRLAPPAGAKRREATRAILELEARTFERIIARAPEQWNTLFFPIWEDGGSA